MAKQCYCKAFTGGKLPHYLVKTAVVPAGQEIQAGAVVALKTIDSDGVGASTNLEVYNADTVTDIKTERLGIVLNDGFETLEDGRRPAGQPDYTQYIAKAGDVVTVLCLVDWMSVEISKDALADEATPTTGQYLIPVNGEYTLTSSAAADTSKVYLRVDAPHYIRSGGNFGSGFIQGYIVTAFVADDVA